MPRKLFSTIAVVGLLVAAPLAGTWALANSQTSMIQAGVAVAAMVLGSLITPSGQSGNRLTLTIAAAAALPFIFLAGDRVDVSGVIGVYLIGSELLVLVEYARSGVLATSFAYAGRQFVGYSIFTLVFALVRDVVGRSLGSSGWEILVPFVAGGVAWIAVELLLWSLAAAGDFRLPTRYVALSGVKDLNVFISLVATGGLFGLMLEPLGWWALPVALLPYSFAHGAFRRFQETKTTYRQTIRALAQIPEVAGLNLTGHSDRTAALAVAMAKDLGLTPEEVEEVEFAALMHDIGHITLNDPTVIEQGWTDDDLARWGSEIIAGAPSLDRVAAHVRRQYEPFRNPGEESDPSVSKAARIVKIASAYDSHRVGSGMSQLEALEELHQGAAYEYDPEVVTSLRRILEAGPVNA
ncbi:MAG TPA: HD domain-containing phosphohydrolase [Acidimicrobiia bacterium]|nr:HD domain-containing phosphohydrolase [Acidimicrobiia bacterium]